jgi:hypothetical protein
MNMPWDPWYLICQVCENPVNGPFEEWQAAGPAGVFRGHRECVERAARFDGLEDGQ